MKKPTRVMRADAEVKCDNGKTVSASTGTGSGSCQAEKELGPDGTVRTWGVQCKEGGKVVASAGCGGTCVAHGRGSCSVK